MRARLRRSRGRRLGRSGGFVEGQVDSAIAAGGKGGVAMRPSVRESHEPDLLAIDLELFARGVRCDG